MKTWLLLVGGFLLIGAWACLGGTVLWLLWPVVMVEAFGLPPLTWGQSIALVYIAHLLLSGAKAELKNKD